MESRTTLVSEKTPLLGRKKKKHTLLEAEFLQTKQLGAGGGAGGDGDGGAAKVRVETVMLRKHITLPHAIGMIVGGVAGSGIFISPTGVTQSVQSVALSLIIWVVSGMFNLILSLCYAELGTALPVAGGDFAYLYRILGPLPAFLSLWTTVLLIGPTAGALMGRTVATYLYSIFGVQCSVPLTILMALLVNVTSAVLNAYSVKWSARALTGLSFAKLFALGLVIITGVVRLAQGYTQQFEDPFANSALSAGSLIGGFLPGFASYVGWDAVNNLAEEMANPGRDLPLSLTLSMLVVTLVYLLTNIAYFTVLTPLQFVGSDAVAVEFANRSLGSFATVVPIFVALSAFGSAIGNFLAFPRYAFAGAREGQLPEVCSYVSLKFFTPIPAIILIAIVTVVFSSATFIDIQGLLDLTSIITQIKISLALVALLRLKWKYGHLERTVKIPSVVVILCLALLFGILGIAIIQEPTKNGMAFALFLAGIPIYWAGNWCKSKPGVAAVMDEFTSVMQRLFLIVPGGKS